MADYPPPETGRATAFLTGVAEPGRGSLSDRVAVVVAHPDDETIGCGSLLGRLADVAVFHVTDGAPRSLTDAQALGFSTADAYARARRAELEAAMRRADVPAHRLVPLGWPDQEASLNLLDIARQLGPLIADLDVVITHAYEGGHPDHDATAFAVHAAVGAIQPGRSRSAVVEMPLYRAGQEGWTVQSFVPGAAASETVIELSDAERRTKQAMFDAFSSQRHVLTRFSVRSERFRPAPRYDFGVLPNGGDLLYEQMEWGMTGARWLELSRAALAELQRGAAA